MPWIDHTLEVSVLNIEVLFCLRRETLRPPGGEIHGNCKTNKIWILINLNTEIEHAITTDNNCLKVDEIKRIRYLVHNIDKIIATLQYIWKHYLKDSFLVTTGKGPKWIHF